MERYWKPALLAGSVAGLLSGIPVISCCGCLWIILGVIWACAMYRKEYGFVDIGPGAALGAITGVIDGVISGVLNAVVWTFMGAWYQSFLFSMLQKWNVPESAMENMHMMGWSILGMFAGIVTSAAIGAIVGLIMGAIWKQKPDDAQNVNQPPSLQSPIQ